MEKDLIIKEEKKEELANVYAKVGEEIGNMMKQAVETMTLVTQNTKFVMGEQLSKVQEKLAGKNQYDGFFPNRACLGHRVEYGRRVRNALLSAPFKSCRCLKVRRMGKRPFWRRHVCSVFALECDGRLDAAFDFLLHVCRDCRDGCGVLLLPREHEIRDG